MKIVSEIFQLSATDLSNHLACKHLTSLSRQVETGEINASSWYDPSLLVLIKRGQEHEAAYVEFLKNKILTTAYLKGQPLEATIDAMRSAADVLIQARLDNKIWMGYADILIKVPGKSKFGNWSYEVQDTKLAQNTRANVIIQLCIYTDLLSTLQGNPPEKMYVVKPGENFPTEAYRYTEFQSYYRLVKKGFEEIMVSSMPPRYRVPATAASVWSLAATTCGAV